MTARPRRLGDLPALETPRLRLVRLRAEDAPALAALTDDPLITEAIDFLERPFTREDAAALIRGRGDGRDGFFGVWRQDRLIGVVGAHLNAKFAIEIGYWIGTASQGQGYATEAAGAVIAILQREFPQRRIIAECRRENRASWRVLEKLGFHPTGAAGSRPGRERLALPPSVSRPA
ncbi:MAG TPA: GNAT family N-acetyltransferase [Stellaceae bacterium]|nr:GNAT family N-acetyltransferase [Stellaceae bacterium]